MAETESRVIGKNSVLIGSGLRSDTDYELVIGGNITNEIRVAMTPEEHEVLKRLLERAFNGS